MKFVPAAVNAPRSQSGSALIITLWVAFGLVSLALYFGHSMSLELKVSFLANSMLSADFHAT